MLSLVCPKCKYKTEGDELFCSKCGTKLVSLHNKSFCSSCGAELKPEAEFCSQCGAKQETPFALDNTSSGRTIVAIDKFARNGFLATGKTMEKESANKEHTSTVIRSIPSDECRYKHPQYSTALRNLAIGIDGYFSIVISITIICLVFGAISFLESSSSQAPTSSNQMSMYYHRNYRTNWSPLSFLYVIILCTLVVLIPLLIDSALYAIFGNTIANWAFGFKILDEYGNKISSKEYLSRNMAIFSNWYDEFFHGKSFQFNKKKKDSFVLTYDKKMGFAFIQEKTSWLISLLKIIVLIMLILSPVFLYFITSQM